jgi:hypothetical protein
MTWQSDRPSTDSPARPKKAIDRQIRSLVLCVDLVGSRPIWPAQVGCVVDPDGSRRNQADRLDDQARQFDEPARVEQTIQRLMLYPQNTQGSATPLPRPRSAPVAPDGAVQVAGGDG